MVADNPFNAEEQAKIEEEKKKAEAEKKKADAKKNGKEGYRDLYLFPGDPQYPIYVATSDKDMEVKICGEIVFLPKGKPVQLTSSAMRVLGRLTKNVKSTIKKEK